MAGSDIFGNDGLGESLIDSANLGAPLDDSNSLLGVSKEIKETASGAEPLEELERITQKDGADSDSDSNDEENSTVNKFQQPTLFNQQPYIPPVPYRSNVDGADFLTGEKGDGTLVNFSAFDSLSNSGAETVAAPLKFSQADSNNLVIDGDGIPGELTITDRSQDDDDIFIDEYILTTSDSSQLVKLEIISDNSDIYIEVFNKDTQEVIASSYDTDSKNKLFANLQDENYTVRVISDSEIEQNIAYTLKATSSQISPNNGSVSVTSPEQRYTDDYYELKNIKVGNLVKLNINSSAEWSSTYIEVIDANTQDTLIEEEVNPSDATDKDIAFIPASNTSYLVRIYNNSESGITYTLDINDEKLQELSVGDEKINGTFTDKDIVYYDNYLNKNRVDYYQLADLEVDKSITIEASSFNSDLYNTIELINADTNDWIGGSIGGEGYGVGIEQLTFTPQADINYAIRVGGYIVQDENESLREPLGQYELKIKETSKLSSGQNIQGKLENIDFHNIANQSLFVDNYLLTDLKEGQIVALNLSSEAFNPSLRIVEADNQGVIDIIDEDLVNTTAVNIDDIDNAKSDKNAHVVFTPEANTDYMVWVSTNENGGLGSYNLSVKTLDEISVVDTEITGNLNTKDVYHPDEEGKFIDEYQLTGFTSGDTVNIELKPTSDNFNTSLEIYSIEESYSGKKEVVKLNKNTNFDIYNNFASQAFLVPEDGVEYFVRVTSENRGETGNYTLTNSTGKPDLKIDKTNINNGKDIFIDQPFIVSWNGINQNDDGIKAALNWNDSIYLSKDKYFNKSEDILLKSVSIVSDKLPLESGETYNLNATVTITDNLGKNPYLIFVADSENNLIETDEENYFAQQIEVKLPDLKIEPVDIPSTALIGDNIEIDWKVDNIGTTDINGSWTDRIWISKDEVISEDDTLLLTQKYDDSAFLDASDTYPHDNTIIPIPSKEALKNEVEGNDGNNSIETANDISPNFELTATDTYIAEINAELNIDNNFDNDYFEFYASPGDKIIFDIFSRQESDTSNLYLNLYTKEGDWLAENDPLNGIYQLSHTFTDSDYKGKYYINIFDNYDNKVEYTLKTTLETPNLITSQLRDGSYNLIFETDIEDKIKESDENNNFITKPIFLTSSQLILDLEISVEPLDKTTAVIGEEIEVTWTVTNTSDNAQALADWSDSIYISTNEDIKKSDVPVIIKSAAEKTPLQPGESYTFTEKVTLPNSIGKYNILLVTDTNKNQVETDEDNNFVKIPIEVIAPDLKVESLNGVSTAEFGETIELTWETKNIGDADSTAGNERIWLSTDDDANYNSNKDFLLQPVNTTDINYASITGKSSITRSASVTLPDGIEWKEGEYYIFVEADINDTTSESNEGNNISTSKAIYLSLPPIPDLTVDNVTVSKIGKPSEEISISWNVYNSDTETTVNGSWTDKIYLIAEKDYSSTDGYSLNDAIALDTFSYTAKIPSLDKHGIKDYKVTLPSDIADGDYRVIIVTDERDDIYEGTKENNNRGVSTGKLTVGRVDLIPKIIEVDTNPTSGDKITLRWEVTNNGSATTSGTWVDRVYLSEDSPENFSANSNDFKGEIVHETGLASQQKYPGELEIKLPLDISGKRYLYVVSDAADNITELDSTGNDAELNTVHQKLNITLAEYADLEVSDISVTKEAIGNPATIKVDWKVTNIGTGKGKTDKWEDRIIASVDDDITNGDGVTDDIVIATFDHTGFLDAKSINQETSYYTRSKDIQLPPGFEGKYNLYVETGFSSIFENKRKGNNLDKADKPFFVAPRKYSDLIVTNIQTETTSSKSGETVKLTWTVKNQGKTVTNTNSWSDSVVLYKISYDSDSKEVIEEVYSQRFDRIGALSNDDENGNNTYTRTVDIKLPLELAKGNYYFEVTTGENNSSLYESIYDDNNSKDNQKNPVFITPSPAPDFTVDKVTVVDTAIAGEKIDVTWEVINQSQLKNALGSWVDKIYLEEVEEVGVTNPTTYYLGDFTYNGDIGASKNYKRTETFTLNQRIEGRYKVVVETNVSKSLYEINDTDNSSKDNSAIQSIIDISLPDRPNLEIESIEVPQTEIKAGTTVQKDSIVFTVENRGTIEATGTWTDRVYLSLDTEISNDDIIIASLTNATALQPLNTNTSSDIPDTEDKYRTVVTETFDIPKWFAGDAYIIVQTDAGNTVDEYPYSEKNVKYEKIIIDSLDPSDLVTSDVKVINEAYEGSEIKVSYKVTNEGSGETDRDRWTDSVWLTTEPNRRPRAESGDILLDNFIHNGALQTTNDSIDVTNYYEKEVTVKIPNQISGKYYITVWSNSNEDVTEVNYSNTSNLDDSDNTNNNNSSNNNQSDDNSSTNPQEELEFNNFSSRPITVKLQPSPDLTVSNIKIDETPNPEAGEKIKITWDVLNESDISTEEDYWYDEVYISDKPTLEDKSAKKWYLGRYQRNSKLAGRDGYTGELETILSPGVQGKYIIVKTNVGENVWEGVYTNNNEDELQQDITTTQSDLEVIGIEVKPDEDKNYSGDKTKIEWTVINNGEPVWEGTRYWYDEIWISDKEDFNAPNATLTKIGFVPYSPKEQFGKGDTYTNSTEVTLPPGYDGEYFIHVSTNKSYDRNTSRFSGSLPEEGNNDSRRESFEYRVHEDTSNNLLSKSIPITYREADLQISNVRYSEIDQISGVQSGEIIEVTWDVTNKGTRDTREILWYDRVYLSQDGSLDSSDVYLGEFKRKGILKIDDGNPDNGVEINSYQGFAKITLPEGIKGNYQLLVFTDSNLVKDNIIPNIGFEGSVNRTLARVPEFDDEGNNIDSTPLSVTLRPSADLQVTNVKINADNSKAIAGQSFSIDYTVTNLGDGDTPSTQQEWTDLIYLSRDQYLDLDKDIFLNYVDHEGILEKNNSYTVTNKILNIPVNLAGLYNNEAIDSASYFVFVVTDPSQRQPRGKVYEGEFENNNSKHSDQPLIGSNAIL